jgi:1-acyl-sn-glycerol-3-phosphate acyltransferase
MIQPTTEQLQVLTGIERFWFRVANFVLRYLRPLSIVWNQIFMVHFSWIMTGRRVRRWGMEHTEVLGPDSCVIVVANHRSFFDFYVIGPILYTQTNLSKHILFPVRAPFFYDKWIGGIVNGIMSGFFMFPPVMRAKEKRTYNNYALQRMVEELERPGQQLGIHPEGTRGKGDDPYTFLRTQPGVGKILSKSKHTVVLPVFITGLTNNMVEEIRRNWLGTPSAHPIDVVFGPVVHFDDLRVGGDRLAIQMRIAQRCMDAVGDLANWHKHRFAEEE